MPPVIWYSLQLKKIIKTTSTCWRFLFDLQSEEVFNYTAGQFLTCDLPTGEKRAQRWRSYSIANANQKNKVQQSASKSNSAFNFWRENCYLQNKISMN